MDTPGHYERWGIECTHCGGRMGELYLKFSIFISQTALTIPSVLFQLDHLPDECQDDEETEPPPRRYSTTQEQHELDEKIRKFQRSSMSRRSSALQSPLLEEVIARITQSFSSRSEIVSMRNIIKIFLEFQIVFGKKTY